MSLYKWSQTAGTNATVDGTINWAEGQAPSSVNDSARALMAAVAKYRDDHAGLLTTGGTSTAYTVATYQVFASLAAMNAQSIRVRMHATCGASPTLNADGLGAKAIVGATGDAIPSGFLTANSVYEFVYDNGAPQWILVGGVASLFQFPTGTAMLFAQTSAPTGWTKSVTHNDKALRIVNGVAGSGGSTAFATVFSARTILTANLPPYTPAGTVAVASGTIGATSSQITGNNGASGGAAQYLSSNSAATGVSQTPTITVNDTRTWSFTGTAQGGTSTAIDFNVAYVDVIMATRD